MKGIETILQETSHRPFPLPQGSWKYCREWHEVVFVHWRVPAEAIRKLVPGTLEIDLLNGEAWVSLVVFVVKDLRPRILPPYTPVSDFMELNMRTYVLRRSKPGIYFLNLEAEKSFPSFLARLITGLNYYKSSMNHIPGYYESENLQHLSYLKAVYSAGESVQEKSTLDRWLTDRFCLFRELSGNIYSNDIHHQDWPLKRIEVRSLEVNYRFGDLLINGNAGLCHYSDGVQVATWGKSKA